MNLGERDWPKEENFKVKKGTSESLSHESSEKKKKSKKRSGRENRAGGGNGGKALHSMKLEASRRS